MCMQGNGKEGCCVNPKEEALFRRSAFRRSHSLFLVACFQAAGKQRSKGFTFQLIQQAKPTNKLNKTKYKYFLFSSEKRFIL